MSEVKQASRDKVVLYFLNNCGFVYGDHRRMIFKHVGEHVEPKHAKAGPRCCHKLLFWSPGNRIPALVTEKRRRTRHNKLLSLFFFFPFSFLACAMLWTWVFIHYLQLPGSGLSSSLWLIVSQPVRIIFTGNEPQRRCQAKP